MSRKKFIAGRENKIAASSSSNDADDHESLGADQEQAQAFTYDVGSSSTMSQRRGGPFIAGSIYSQVRDLMEGRPSNVSLFCFRNDMFNNF
jgi:hypothetical protein